MNLEGKVDNNHLIAVTMGDPAGIGPEVCIKAMSEVEVPENCTLLLFGNILSAQNAIGSYPQGNKKIFSVKNIGEISSDPNFINVFEMDDLQKDDFKIGEVSSEAGKASVEYVLKAGQFAIDGEISAIVTAPINKESCRLAGFKDIGHMEIFQSQSNSKEVATMLIAENLRVVHLTTHKSLKNACEYVTKENVLSKIILTNTHFQKWGFKEPKIGVCALNPHAGDGGLIGDEEEKFILPAVSAAQKMGISSFGPIPADSIFFRAIQSEFDVVLAMYHDQGHIPIKVYNWEKSISVNLGLPFIRTSVDHGTAFDIAGKGVAQHTSMLEAIKTAINLIVKSKIY